MRELSDSELNSVGGGNGFLTSLIALLGAASSSGLVTVGGNGTPGQDGADAVVSSSQNASPSSSNVTSTVTNGADGADGTSNTVSLLDSAAFRRLFG